MKNYKELLFATKTSLDVNKGGFDYENHTPEKDGDIVCVYKKIFFIGTDKIEIDEVTERAYNLKIYGEYHREYSVKRDDNKILGVYTFEELKNSEYWDSISERYYLNETEYKRYEANSVYEDDEQIEAELHFQNNNILSLKYNKFDNYITIYTKNTAFSDCADNMVILDREEYDELLENEKIIKLMRDKHNVQILENGYVVDDVYYEYIDEIGSDK